MQFDCTVWTTATSRNFIAACGVIVAMVLSGCGQERPPQELLVTEARTAKGNACVFVVMSTHPSDMGMRWLLSVSDATVSHAPGLPDNMRMPPAAMSASKVLAGDSKAVQLWEPTGADSPEWAPTTGVEVDFDDDLAGLLYVCSSISVWPNQQGYTGYAIARSAVYQSESQIFDRAHDFELFGIRDSGEIERVGHGTLPAGRIDIDRNGRVWVAYQSEQDFQDHVKHIFEYVLPLDALQGGVRSQEIAWDSRRSVDVSERPKLLAFVDGRALWETRYGYAFEEDEAFVPLSIPDDGVVDRLVAGRDSFVIATNNGNDIVVYSRSGTVLDAFSFRNNITYNIMACVDSDGNDRYAILSGRDLHVLQLRGDEVIESRKRLKLAQ
ncbi:MAG: hypothetical protein JJU33_10410 [Phycisphaerales bacterium]|nr:hypothetical protein [Phycisphaerales bacterium]